MATVNCVQKVSRNIQTRISETEMKYQYAIGKFMPGIEQIK